MSIKFSVILSAVVLSQLWLIIHVLESLPDKTFRGVVEVSDCDVQAVGALRQPAAVVVPLALVTAQRPTSTPKPRRTTPSLKSSAAPPTSAMAPKTLKRRTMKRSDEIFR